jgi:cell division protease FtsH
VPIVNDPRHNASGGGGPPANGSGPRRPRLRLSGRTRLILLVLVLLVNLLFYAPFLRPTSQAPQISLPYSTFLAQVRTHNVTTVLLSPSTASGAFARPYLDPGSGRRYSRYTTTLLPVPDPALVSLLMARGVQITAENQTPSAWLTAAGLFISILPLLFLFGLFYIVARAARGRQQGILGFGQSKAKLYTAERPSTTFADVAGVEAAKSELREEVDFLRDAAKYQRLGARIPKGVLLVGPPGTGKTLLARAVAGEAQVPFFSISATEFVEMFVGVGASRVRDLFVKAKAAAPCIIFIDEIDAIGRQRGGPLGGGTNDEREQTLNQLLVSLDGFEPNQAVIVLAATNRPDGLDAALLRPGRFDRQVMVDPPDRRGREAILTIHTRAIPLASSVSLAALAQATPGMSGADLANLANEAALTAARKGESQVTPVDFEEALDRITLGAPGTALIDAQERRTVAYHEGGHALVASLLPNVDPVHRVTIMPRGRSLGVTQFRPLDDRRTYRRDYLLGRLAVGLGGRAAEEMACEEITSGAQDDIQQVTRLARTMVMQLGMADELGPVYFGGSGDDALSSRTFNLWAPKEYSDETAQRIDAAVHRLTDEAHERARAVLRGNRAALDAIADALVREESLDAKQLAALITMHHTPVQEPTPERGRLPGDLIGIAARG